MKALGNDPGFLFPLPRSARFGARSLSAGRGRGQCCDAASRLRDALLQVDRCLEGCGLEDREAHGAGAPGFADLILDGEAR